MKIQTISIEGFWGYREPVHVDIDGLPLLVAVGHNGSGKSALIVSAVLAGLYGKFPTRTVEESITTGAQAGYITIEFTVAEVLYRVSRSHQRSGASSASVYRMVDGSWEAVAEKGVREVNAAVTELLGMNYDTAVMTWVAEQGKYGSFASALPAARFKMLATVFDLAKYGPMHKAAKDKLKAAGEAVAVAEGRVAELNDSIVDDDARDGDQVSDEDLAAKVTAAHDALDQAAAGLIAHQQNDPAVAVARARTALDAVKNVRLERLNAAEGKLTELRSNRDEEPTRRDTAIARATASFEVAVTATKSRTAASMGIVEGRIAAALAEQTEFEEAARALPQLRATAAALEAAYGPAHEKVEQARAHLSDCELAVARAADALRAAQTAAADAIDTLDVLAHAGDCYACGQHISEQVAENLRSAQQAVIDTREAEVASARAAQADAAHALEDAQVAFDDAARAENDIQVNENRNSRAVAAAERAVEDAERAAETVTREQDVLAQLRNDFADAIGRLTDDHDAEVARITAESAARMADVVARGKDAAAQVTALRQPTADEQQLEAALAEAEKVAVDNATFAAERDRLVEARDRAREHASTLDAEVGRRAEVARRQAEQEERIAAAKKALAEAEEQVLIYTDLTAAYSPSGIPSMVLASVIDDLNAAINVTLAELSGGNLEVRLSTSRETAGGAQESKVTVYVDTPTGPRAYEALSGGQRFRVDLAIRMGLAAIIASGTGTPIETFILDEGWGSLDEAGIRSTLEVLGRLSEQVNVLTVSHVDTVREAFPARIEVTTNEGTAKAEVIR